MGATGSNRQPKSQFKNSTYCNPSPTCNKDVRKNWHKRLKEYAVEIKLNIIPRPRRGTRTVIESKVSPAFKGEGNVDYICGNCRALIAEKVHRGQIRNIVVHCPKCSQYNEFP